MLANDTRPETSSVDVNLYLLSLHLFLGEFIIHNGIAWHRCPKRDEEVCHLATNVSVNWLCASGELNSILWPECPLALDADVIFLDKGKSVPCLRKPGTMGISA